MALIGANVHFVPLRKWLANNFSCKCGGDEHCTCDLSDQHINDWLAGR
jgi:hypothetical protein